MYSSKLIDMFKKLSNRDLTKLGLYLQSPIFNRSENILKLYEIIKAEHPNYEGTRLDKDIVFKQLFPQKKKQDSSLRALMSQLSKMIEDFLVFTALEDDEYLRNELLLRSLMERRMDHTFRKKLDQMSKKMTKKPQQDINFFYHTFKLSDLAFQQMVPDGSRTPKLGLEKTITNLDIYYIASKLRYTTAILNLQNVVRGKYELHLIDEVLQLVASSQILTEVPFIKFYYYLCLLLRDNDETYFYKLKELLRAESNILIEDEARHIYTALSNYCTKRIKMGEQPFLEELFELYQDMLDTNMLIIGKHMTHYNYKNIATAALKLRKYEWASWFIEEYRSKVLPAYRESVYNYNLALFYFHKKDYQKAGQHLLNVEFLDPYYHLTYKLLQIKTYYEEGEMIPLKSAIDALRQYIRRDKIMSANNAEACQNFINLLNRVYRIRNGGTRSIDALIDNIKGLSNVGERQWLLEKTMELKAAIK